MATILVTGSNGQVGQELQFLAKNYPSLRFIFTDVGDVDITDSDNVFHFFKKHAFDYCINCAAFTAVDKAEEEVDLARRINIEGVKNIAQACTLHQTALIHLSTDYVYSTGQNTPFKEINLTDPKSVYARTKLEGEQIAQVIHPSTMIIRTSWVYSSFGHNFVKTMQRLGTERDQLSVVFDQIGTPTYARDLANAIVTIIHKVETEEVDSGQMRGIYHYSNEGVCSWYDFALAIFELDEINCQVNPIESKEYPTPANRPAFSVLNKTKIKNTFDIEIPHWRSSLKNCLVALKAMVH